MISEHPQKRLVIRIPSGSLRFRDPAFSEPVVAEQADMTIDLGNARRTDQLGYPPEPTRTDQARLDLVGKFSRAEIDASGEHDLELSLKAARWPWTLTSPLIESRGELTGAIERKAAAGAHLARPVTRPWSDLAAVGSISGGRYPSRRTSPGAMEGRRGR